MKDTKLKAAKLRRLMAIQAMTPHRLPKRPSEVERSMANVAVNMLILVQTLPYAMIDLENELAAAGLFRHEIKRRHRQAEEIIFTVTEPAYLVFARYARELARDYLDRMEQFYIHAKEQIPTSGVCGALDLLMAICNLVERYNRSLEITYYFDRAEPLYKVPRLLDCVPGERRDITSQLEGILQTYNRERYGKN